MSLGEGDSSRRDQCLTKQQAIVGIRDLARRCIPVRRFSIATSSRSGNAADTPILSHDSHQGIPLARAAKQAAQCDE